jgi:hypothetical protein
MSSDNPHPAPDPVYLFGCDMGGWQSADETKGDALAVCKWTASSPAPQHVVATAAVLFFPVAEESDLVKYLRQALAENARIVVAIDAALAWPVEFTRLVANAAKGLEYDRRQFPTAISNPYLYRETERFIKLHVRKGKDPLTAPGDKFGNNSSKAQMLVAWFRGQLPDACRPPFGGWEAERARLSRHTIIEVYPDASRHSRQFKALKWPAYQERIADLGNKDIADAKVCAMTGLCYAMAAGLIPSQAGYPLVYLPDHPLTSDIRREVIPEEGWIFTPFDAKPGRG